MISGYFKSLSIRSRLLLSYILAFTFILVLSFSIVYFLVKSTLEKDIEKNLSNFTQIIHGMVTSAADSSIKNYLRSKAETNLDFILDLYHRAKINEITEKEAKEAAEKFLLNQVVGDSGYIYCINSKGVVLFHPQKDLVNQDISNFKFVQYQIQKKNGYLEYEWANAGEKRKASKALYMCHFPPWDWIISVSVYCNEFNQLISVNDFKDHILSLTFGKTGYPFIINSEGLLIIHPKLEGSNIYNSTDDSGRMFIKQMCEAKNGKILYPWKNPGDPVARTKLVVFTYIAELDWIVASSGYMEEFYSPIRTIGVSTLITAIVMLLIIAPITWLISSWLAEPLQEMISIFGSKGQVDFSRRMKVRWGAEMGQLAENYNKFIDKLQSTSLKLLESEEKYRGIFENSMEGICRIARDGKLLTINPAMANIFGYESTGQMIEEVKDIGAQLFKCPDDQKQMYKLLYKDSGVNNHQVEFFKKDKTTFWCSLSLKAYKNDANEILYIDGFFTDITDYKDYEKALKTSQRELEGKVEKRTQELSSWIKELEQLNLENALFRNMNEMIQICSSSAEIYKIAHQYIQKFFPDTSGMLLEYDKETKNLFNVLTWGNNKGESVNFIFDECWALRQGKPYFNHKQDRLLRCPHFMNSPDMDSLCVPMIFQGETLGLFYVIMENPSDKADSVANNRKLSREKEVGTTISEYIAMALANVRLQSSLKQKSIIDQLTGLHNRRFMDETLKLESSRMVRNKYKVGIIMLDVDHFKKFNDTYGHDCGDAVLKSLGEFLKKNTRGEDIACRYGGEEFVIVLINTTLEGLQKKAGEICAKIRETLVVKHKKQSYKITVSVGSALCPVHAITLSDALEMADAALYEAKNMGRDMAVIAPIAGD